MSKVKVFVQTNKKCNFNCQYCCLDKGDKTRFANTPIKESLVSFVRDKIDTEMVWFSGGEPFLVPNLIDIMSELTNNKINCGLNTNLTTNRLEEMLKRCDINYISVNPAIHYRELEARRMQEKWVNNYNTLKNAGIRKLGLTCVAYPDISTEELKGYTDFYESRCGFKIDHNAFLGQYQGKRYPDSYSPEEISRFNLSEEKLNFLEDSYTCFGIDCVAGSDSIAISEDGTVYPCMDLQWTARMSMGHIEDPNFKIFDCAIKCPLTYCGCPANKL
jgi:MoaA/NifB/PqqE/SkfB family radical SAM enzyme